MSTNKNPFIDLYVTESISADTFVKVFSTTLLDDAETLSLYQPGNVLLMGLQGSGKTALLNLLKPEVLIAYRRAGVSWPLPEHCSKFISAGINLSKSGVLDFGQRAIAGISVNEEDRRYAMYFADFLNYWIVDDLLQSIETLYFSEEPDVRDFLGIDASNSKLDKFAVALANKSCWHRALEDVKSYEQLRKELDNRILAYRSFLNYNTDSLPDTIKRSKTSAGEPISITVDILRKFEIIPVELPVLIRIDQFEDLLGLEEINDNELRVEYRAVIFKMMGTRDERVSYRVGARPYAVHQNFRMLGTASAIEERRNFILVNIDSILRRTEHSRGIFPKFAEDVFSKRLKEAGYKIPKVRKLLSYVFGSKPYAEERAQNYIKESVEGVIQSDTDWPDDAEKFLKNLAKDNILSAKLGESWLRQQLYRNLKKTPDIKDFSWEKPERRWWKKERIEQAILQIAAARRQRMIWFGDADVLALSGGNILVFLSICQLIWAEYLRTDRITESDTLPEIHSSIVQDLGIQQASEYWYRKLRADPNGGDDRYRFISIIAGELRTGLRDDKRMSYPGANGFSLADRDLDTAQEINSFLDMCTAYGALTMSRHTPKSSQRGESKKWYLFPILTPYFQIPTAHTKEPLYINVNKIEEWLDKSKVYLRTKIKSSPVKVDVKKVIGSSEQLSLFSNILDAKK